jgi:hypothetical protein
MGKLAADIRVNPQKMLEKTSLTLILWSYHPFDDPN